MTWRDWNYSFKDRGLTKVEKEILELFERGNTIDEISKIKGIKIETTQRHIINLILKSFISISDIIDKKNKLKKLEINISNNYLSKSLKELMRDLKENNIHINWFELKAFIAHLNSKPKKFKKNNSKN